MKKTLSFFMVLFCLIKCTKSQHNAFINYYNGTESLLLTTVTENGGYYSISRSFNCPNDSIRVRYFDNSGTLKWNYRTDGYIGHLLGGLRGVCATVGKDNQLLFYFFTNESKHLIYKIDTLGNVLFKKQWQYNDALLYKKILHIGSNYYFVGNTDQNNSSSILTKIANNGDIVWNKEYKNNGTPSTIYINDMIEKENKLICIGRINYGNQMKPLLFTLDTSGNVLNGTYYKVDSNNANNHYEFYQIEKTPQGKFYILAKSNLEHAIIRIDDNYDLKWVQYYYNECSAICAGYKEDVFTTNYYYNLLLQIDSAGNHVNNHITKESQIGYNYELYSGYGYTSSIAKRNCGFLISKVESNIILQTNPNGDYCMDSTNSTPVFFIPLTKNARANLSILTQSYPIPAQNSLTLGWVVFPISMFTYCSSNYNCDSPNFTNDILEEQSINVYPIPTRDYIIVDVEHLGKKNEIEIVNMQGIKLETIKEIISGKNQIDLSRYSSGIYILRINIDGRTNFSKVHKL